MVQLRAAYARRNSRALLCADQLADQPAYLPLLVNAASIPNLELVMLANNRITNLQVSSRVWLDGSGWGSLHLHALRILFVEGPGKLATGCSGTLNYHSLAPASLIPDTSAACSHALAAYACQHRVHLQDLDPLASLPKLTHLCLSGNPVAMKTNYR